MSRLMIRPPGPLPAIDSSGTFLWAAIERASGLALTRPPGPGGAGRRRLRGGGRRAVARRLLQHGLDVLLRVGDHADERAHRRLAARRDEDLAQDAVAEGLHLHVGLVRLDLRQHVADLDLVALFLAPLDDGALLHRRGELREDDL